MSGDNERPIKMTIYSTPAHLPVVRAAVDKACHQAGFDDETAGAVVLSVDEALTNIIKHAYGGAGDQQIDVELRYVGSPAEALQIRLRDYGPRVDPQQIKSRDLADVRPGGLGVHIISECMDGVEFEPGADCGTVLTMIKRLPAGKEAN